MLSSICYFISQSLQICCIFQQFKHKSLCLCFINAIIWEVSDTNGRFNMIQSSVSSLLLGKLSSKTAILDFIHMPIPPLHGFVLRNLPTHDIFLLSLVGRSLYLRKVSPNPIISASLLTKCLLTSLILDITHRIFKKSTAKLLMAFFIPDFLDYVYALSFAPDFEFFRVTAYFGTLFFANYLMISTHLTLVTYQVTDKRYHIRSYRVNLAMGGSRIPQTREVPLDGITMFRTLFVYCSCIYINAYFLYIFISIQKDIEVTCVPF